MGSVGAAASVRGRLAVLSAHLLAATAAEYDAGSSTVLEQSPVSAQVGPPAPGNLGGRLTVIDGRTGKKYEVEVSQEGTVRATDLKKITTGKDDKGIKLYDPGYLNTAPVRSSICYIDGDAGILRYRGYPIEELAESSTFLEVAYLLMYGNLPSQSQLADWEFAISQHSAVPQGLLDIIQAMPHDAHPMGVLVSAMSALSVFHPDANPALRGQGLYQSKQVRDKQIARILGKAPTIAAAAYLRLAGRPPVLPSSNLSYSENFLYLLDSLGDRAYKPNPRLARVLDILFILHAEHEMNCSTAAARHLASSGVDVYTALAGAVGALYGPLHGGANEAVLKMLNEIGKVENIPEFIEGVKNRKRKMSGFGHRVYKNYDPRAKVIKKLAEEVFSIVGRDPLIEVAVALEKAALSDEYFVKRKLYPNVDFYSGLIYRAMGFPTEFFPVLFAVPRMAGYLAHWRESLDDPDTKIMRPQQKLSLVNGVVFTGGWAKRGLYFETAQYLFEKILERNDAGDHFPLFAICLGFEILSMFISKDNNILEQFGAREQASTLQFIKHIELQGTVFQRFPPELLRKLSEECLVMQNHYYGISPKRLQGNAALSNFFRILTTSTDDEGQVYVSTVQALQYPVTAFQWHPEKNAFEWGLSMIPHTEDAVQVTQLVANFLISEARRSSNRPRAEKVLENIIYNYSPIYCGKAGRGFDEVYIFS